MCSSIPVRFERNLNCHKRFSKNTQIPNLMKIRSVGAEMFHADGQTDVTKLIVAFRTFANAPKNVTLVITDNMGNSHAPKTT